MSAEASTIFPNRLTGGESMAKIPYMFEHLTWEEVNDAVQAGKCALIPVGTLEDHGPHLPVDADVVIVSTICERTAQLAPEEMVLLPCIRIGYSPHHIDFPGTLTIRWTTFVSTFWMSHAVSPTTASARCLSSTVMGATVPSSRWRPG